MTSTATKRPPAPQHGCDFEQHPPASPRQPHVQEESGTPQQEPQENAEDRVEGLAGEVAQLAQGQQERQECQHPLPPSQPAKAHEHGRTVRAVTPAIAIRLTRVQPRRPTLRRPCARAHGGRAGRTWWAAHGSRSSSVSRTLWPASVVSTTLRPASAVGAAQLRAGGSSQPLQRVQARVGPRFLVCLDRVTVVIDRDVGQGAHVVARGGGGHLARFCEELEVLLQLIDPKLPFADQAQELGDCLHSRRIDSLGRSLRPGACSSVMSPSVGLVVR